MARLGAVGDRIIIMAFAQLGPAELAGYRPKVVVLDSRNRIVERIDYPPLSLDGPFSELVLSETV
jgi:aspartate 1-decarboxylase